MTFLEVTFGAICILLFALAAFLARTLYNTGVIVLRVQDTLEESLETIDDRVESIEKILEIPLFSDSPEIKRLRKDMLDCREAILDVAYSLSNSMTEKETTLDPEMENQ